MTVAKKRKSPTQINYAPLAERIERLMLSLSDPILPMAGIEELLIDRGVVSGSKQYNRLREAHRINLKKGTAGVHQIDEMCVTVLRRHPAELYGDEWYDEPKAADSVTPEAMAA